MAVLHMILIVLKILGVILLIILGILLLVTAAFLFCPVRYRAAGYNNERAFGGEAGISWLFHLVSFKVWYESKNEKAEYSLYILGIPVLELISNISNRRKKTRKPGGKQPVHTEISSKEEIRKEPENEKNPGVVKHKETGRNREVDRKNKGKNSFVSKLKELLQIPGKFLRTLKNFQLTAEHICAKIKNIKTFLENEKFKRGRSLIFQEVKKLLAHGVPRKINGYVKFGTEDPCFTGEILGAAGIFYPLYGENFNIEPCFDQAVLEGTVSFKGRIYGIFLLVSVLKIISSKDVRYIIRHFN